MLKNGARKVALVLHRGAVVIGYQHLWAFHLFVHFSFSFLLEETLFNLQNLFYIFGPWFWAWVSFISNAHTSRGRSHNNHEEEERGRVEDVMERTMTINLVVTVCLLTDRREGTRGLWVWYTGSQPVPRSYQVNWSSTQDENAGSIGIWRSVYVCGRKVSIIKCLRPKVMVLSVLYVEICRHICICTCILTHRVYCFLLCHGNKIWKSGVSVKCVGTFSDLHRFFWYFVLWWLTNHRNVFCGIAQHNLGIIRHRGLFPPTREDHKFCAHNPGVLAKPLPLPSYWSPASVSLLRLFISS